MRILKRILYIALALVLAIAVSMGAIWASFLVQLNKRTQALEDDYSKLAQIYDKPVSAGPAEPITQKITCGYAVIEMFGQWEGSCITEEILAASYDYITTSTADGFCREMNRQFPDYVTEKQSWLTQPQLLRTVYETLRRGIPVPIQWAAQLDGQWTLHYSLVTGMDLPADKITVLNPYGCKEILTQEEFLNRTSFQAYADMPLWLKTAFALDVFEKNTVFSVTRAEA